MSSEAAQKRGRPKKVESVELPSAGKEAPAAKSPKKVTPKVATKTTATKGNVSPTKPPTKTAAANSSRIENKPKVVASAPSSVPSSTKSSSASKQAKSELVSRSQILQELAALDAVAPRKRTTDEKIIIEAIKTVVAEPVQSINPPSLIQSVPIPSHQASTMPSIMAPLLYNHNPNASILQRTAYMSTKSKAPEGAAKASRPNAFLAAKEINKIAVNQQSSRGGQGAGAEYTRSDQAKAETPRGEPAQPGELSAKYKSAARRYVHALVQMVRIGKY
jgi:hypothetical protein